MNRNLHPSVLTGHPTVDAIAHIRFEGDITPKSWYKHICYQTKSGDKKADRLAIDILSDIVYWYRPYQQRDELTGEEIGWKKKFKEDLLRHSPDAFAESLNASPRCIRESMHLLERMGLIKVVLQPVETPYGVLPNVMHIDICPEAIAAITYRTVSNQNAETLEKSLLTKWVTTNYETRNKELRIRQQGATKSVTTSYETRNLSIYRDFKEISTKTSSLSLNPSHPPVNPEEEEKKEEKEKKVEFGFQIPEEEPSSSFSSPLLKKSETTQLANQPLVKATVPPPPNKVRLTKLSAEASWGSGGCRGSWGSKEVTNNNSLAPSASPASPASPAYPNRIALPPDPFFKNRRVNPKDIAWDWLPDGPWRNEFGKLDAEFQTALATRWMKEYGGDLHANKAKVLKHFRNEPTNLPIEWEWYQSTFIHRVVNIQTRRSNGMDTTHEELQIAKQARAVVSLPQQMRVTQPQTSSEVVEQVASYALPILNTDAPALQESPSQLSPTPNLTLIASDSPQIEPPKDEFGCINPQAYSTPIKPQDREFWANFTPNVVPITKKLPVSNQELEAAKAVIEALKAKKRQQPEKLTPLAQIVQPAVLDDEAMLQDMRKYLNCGSDILRQKAIDWASDPNNQCQLVKANGRVIDIQWVDF